MRCYKDAPYYFTLTDTLPASYASVLFGTWGNNLGKGKGGQGMLNLW